MPSPLWPYATPGIPDDLFERLPGIPMSPREVRLLMLSSLRLKSDSVLWDIGAGHRHHLSRGGLAVSERADYRDRAR
jgi:hypothetical protein